MNRIKKGSGILTLVLALALLVGAAFAWRDITQHKTNQFKTTDVQHNVVLVEEFAPVENWKETDEPIKKEVSVRNGQDTDDSEFIYDDAYVRLQFREYMEIGNQEYDYSDVRFMINTSGNFITFEADNEESAIAFAQEQGHDVSGALKPVLLTNPLSNDPDEELWYIPTTAGDVNGQYGKYLVQAINPTDAKSIVDGQTNQSSQAQTNHNDATNDEDKYVIHQWDAENVAGGYAKKSAFTEYVKWTLGADVRLMSEWIEDGSPAGQFWVIDDSEEFGEFGYVYWATPLKHRGQGATKDTETWTSDFLTAVELIQQPAGAAEYDLRVTLDAVSLDELYYWADTAGDDIFKAYGLEGNPIETLRNDILLLANQATNMTKEGSLYDTTSITTLNSAASNGVTIANNDASTLEQLLGAKQALNTAIKEAKIDSIKKLKADIGIELDKIKEMDELEYSYVSWTKLVEAETVAKAAMAKGNVTEEELQEAYDNLIKAIQELNLADGPRSINDKIMNFGGYNWNILYMDTDKNQALIIMDDRLVDDNVVWGPNNNVSYENSGTITLVNTYYDESLKGTPEEEYVLPITWNGDSEISVDNSEDGIKQATLLSKKDQTVYGFNDATIGYPILEGSSLKSTFIRSKAPSGTQNMFCISNDKKGFSDTCPSNKAYGARPVIWISYN